MGPDIEQYGTSSLLFVKQWEEYNCVRSLDYIYDQSLMLIIACII